MHHMIYLEMNSIGIVKERWITLNNKGERLKIPFLSIKCLAADRSFKAQNKLT